MPTLLELQTAMRQSLVHHDSTAASAMLAAHVAPDRLDIYRNTFLLTLTKALRLCFPAVQKLVGEEFFEGAAQVFIAERPPRAAWLDQYGAGFPDFLREFVPAASVPYLGDVAELEWAVNCALHAADTEPLDAAMLAAVAPENQGRIRFVAHPSIAVLQVSYPADAIWRAVLADDDDALAAIDLTCGPIRLLVERRATSVAAERLAERPWQFLTALCAGEAIEAALASGAGFDCASALAEHLAFGRFCRFELAAEAADCHREVTA
jgi:hypothetical protein